MGGHSDDEDGHDQLGEEILSVDGKIAGIAGEVDELNTLLPAIMRGLENLNANINELRRLKN